MPAFIAQGLVRADGPCQASACLESVNDCQNQSGESVSEREILPWVCLFMHVYRLEGLLQFGAPCLRGPLILGAWHVITRQ